MQQKHASGIIKLPFQADDSFRILGQNIAPFIFATLDGKLRKVVELQFFQFLHLLLFQFL